MQTCKSNTTTFKMNSVEKELHGYIQGTGEYLEYTCLPCHRKNEKRVNYVEGGDSKNRSKTPLGGTKNEHHHN